MKWFQKEITGPKRAFRRIFLLKTEVLEASNFLLLSKIPTIFNFSSSIPWLLLSGVKLEMWVTLLVELIFTKASY